MFENHENLKLSYLIHKDYITRVNCLSAEQRITQKFKEHKYQTKEQDEFPDINQIK